jgi:c-di-AMP phosphodiesterase-like protein
LSEIYNILGNHSYKSSDSKLLTGSTIDKYPIILDGGRTIIYISDKSKEAEIRERYEMRRRT